MKNLNIALEDKEYQELLELKNKIQKRLGKEELGWKDAIFLSFDIASKKASA